VHGQRYPIHQQATIPTQPSNMHCQIMGQVPIAPCNTARPFSSRLRTSSSEAGKLDSLTPGQASSGPGGTSAAQWLVTAICVQLIDPLRTVRHPSAKGCNPAAPAAPRRPRAIQRCGQQHCILVHYWFSLSTDISSGLGLSGKLWLWLYRPACVIPTHCSRL